MLPEGIHSRCVSRSVQAYCHSARVHSSTHLTTMNSHTSLVHGDPFGWNASSEEMKVGIFWDFEARQTARFRASRSLNSRLPHQSCPAPEDIPESATARELKREALKLGRVETFKVYRSGVSSHDLQLAGATASPQFPWTPVPLHSLTMSARQSHAPQTTR